MSKALNFTLYADDMERAIKFYSKVLGWQFRKAPPEMGGDKHYFITAGPPEEEGNDGHLEARVGNRTTGNHYRVKSFDEAVKNVKEGGGKVLSYTPMGEMGFHAWCEDTEGNAFGIVEMKGPPPPRPKKK